MSLNSKVVWYEGMFLRPQHFQQQDRYLEALVRERCGHLQPYDWGILQLTLEQEALQQGKLAVRTCRGMLPDGTAFNIPDDDALPEPLVIDTNLRDSRILLGLPDRKDSGEVDREDGTLTVTRYRTNTREVRDNNAGFEDREEAIKIGKRQFRLLVEQAKNYGGYSVIAVAQVIEKRPDQMVMVDETFIPPCLDCRNWPVLSDFLTEIQGLLQQCSEDLARRVGVPEREGPGGMEDLLMLQAANRFKPLFTHWCNMQGLHPEELYKTALQLAGEFATLTRKPRLSLSFPPYDHDDLQGTFKPLLEELRNSLRWRRIRPVIEIPLQGFEGGRYLALVAANQRHLFAEANFILTVKVPAELRQNFPNQCTISPAEELKLLVDRHLAGIRLRSLAAAPPHIPFDKEYNYFELERSGNYWAKLKESHGLAFHVAGEFPGIEMHLWAIREERQ